MTIDTTLTNQQPDITPDENGNINCANCVGCEDCVNYKDIEVKLA